jgi:hypothetical protein
MPVGYWNTASFPSDLAKKSFSAMITRLMPNGQAPLYGLTSRLSEETAYQPEHGYFSKRMLFPSVTLSAAATNVATTLAVVSTANVVPGMIFQNPTTRENILVNAVPDGVSLTVQRGIGTVAAAAVASAEVLYLAGNAYEEASSRPQSLFVLPTRVLNFTQIFRNTWLVSGTSLATGVIAGGTADAESRQDCAMFHAIDIERALIWGQQFSGTRNNQPFRTMNGLINYVTQNAVGNVTTLGATTNWTQLETALDPVFNEVTDPKNPNERLYLCGGINRRVMHNIFRRNSQYMINNEVTEWGLQFDTFKLPRGRFNMVEHPLFNAHGNSVFSRMGIAVDLPSFGVAYMSGRKTQSREFNMAGAPVDNGIDAVGGTLTSELTCLVKNPAANGVLLNATAGVADPV